MAKKALEKLDLPQAAPMSSGMKKGKPRKSKPSSRPLAVNLSPQHPASYGSRPSNRSLATINPQRPASHGPQFSSDEAGDGPPSTHPEHVVQDDIQHEMHIYLERGEDDSSEEEWRHEHGHESSKSWSQFMDEDEIDEPMRDNSSKGEWQKRHGEPRSAIDEVEAAMKN